VAAGKPERVLAVPEGVVFTQQRKVSIVETQPNGVTDASYGRVLSYQSPRTVRLGVRYDFSL